MLDVYRRFEKGIGSSRCRNTPLPQSVKLAHHGGQVVQRVSPAAAIILHHLWPYEAGNLQVHGPFSACPIRRDCPFKASGGSILPFHHQPFSHDHAAGGLDHVDTGDSIEIRAFLWPTKRFPARAGVSGKFAVRCRGVCGFCQPQPGRAPAIPAQHGGLGRTVRRRKRSDG